MIAEDRGIVRREFAAILKRRLEVPGKAAAVYPYHLVDFKGVSPVVNVSSFGTKREPITFMGTKATHRLEINTFVLHRSADGKWTPEMCEDRMDLLELEVSQTIRENQVTPFWDSAAQEEGGWSEIIYIEIGGMLYASESLIVEFA
jgi:hypothetical protein